MTKIKKFYIRTNPNKKRKIQIQNVVDFWWRTWYDIYQITTKKGYIHGSVAPFFSGF